MNIRALAGTMIAAAVVVAAAAPAGAVANTYATTPLDDWGQDGSGYAIDVVGNTVYVGGSFGNAVRYGQSSQRANVMALTLDLAQPPSQSLSAFRADTNGAVRALVVDGDWLYLGGDFTVVNGTSATRLAKVNRYTGAVDAGFGATSPSAVRDLLVVGNSLYVVGDFTKLNGTARKRAAAVDKNNGALLPFNPNLSNKTYAVAYSSFVNRIILGGNFTTVGGTARSFLASVDPGSGALGSQPPTFNSVGDIILDVSVSDDGQRVFAAGGGGFNSAAAWNASGGARLWVNRADGDVQAVKFSRGNVYFGFHDGFGGNTTLRLLAADATTGAVEPGFQPASSGSIGVLALDADGTFLAVAGKFPKMGGINVKGVSIHH